MSGIPVTFFQEYLQNDNQLIHEELWKKLVKLRFPNCKREDLKFSKPPTKEFDVLISIPKCCENFQLEFKTDYRTIHSGNFVFELATVIPEEIFPQAFQGKIKISVGDPVYFDLLKLVDAINNKKIPRANGSRHFLSDKGYYFCYAISKNDAYNTKSIDDIDSYYVFYSRKLAKFIREQYRSHDLIITKSQNKSSKWFTVSMLVHCSEIHNCDFFRYNSNGAKIN